MAGLTGRSGASVAMLTAAALLAGCMVGPDYQAPKAPAVDHLTNAPHPTLTVASDTVGGAPQHFANGADVSGEWWGLFHSPEITARVTEALRANPTLLAAQATLKEARENQRAAFGSLFPSVSGGASAAREQVSLAAFGFPGGGSAEFSLYSGTINVAYTLDVFGGIRRQVESLGAQADYQQAELEAAYLSLTANLVAALLTEASVKEQITATEQIIALYREELDVVQQRFELGAISRAEVLQQQSSLAAALATLPPLRKQLAQERDLIATYLGVLPDEYTQPTIDLASLHLPADLPVSLPSQIVAQRPDIRAYAALLTEAALAAEIDATRDVIRVYSDELDLIRKRFELGAVSRSDVLQQQTSLASQTATLPPLLKAQEQTRDQIATYLGLLPGQYDKPTVSLAAITLPGDLPVSLSSQIVAQRPDVQAYAALLHAATANVGVALANMLPQFNLSGSYGVEGITPAQIFTPSGVIWSIASAIAQPIFQGGALLARKRAAVAAMQAAAAQYSGTVNIAFQNVADALVALSRDAETLQAELAADQAASENLAVAKSQYELGATPYLVVLQAQQSYRNTHLQLVIAEAARFTDTVALFAALGGGWWQRHDVAPEVAKCCGVMP